MIWSWFRLDLNFSVLNCGFGMAVIWWESWHRFRLSGPVLAHGYGLCGLGPVIGRDYPLLNSSMNIDLYLDQRNPPDLVSFGRLSVR